MKPKNILIAMGLVLLIIPLFAGFVGAATVFETAGWIIEDEGAASYEFTADIAPFTYKATITDLSVAPAFGLEDLFLSISTSTEVIDYIFGEGSILFPVVEGATYFANVFATGGGDLEAGNYGLKIEAVPIPAALLLLGSGLSCLIAIRRRYSP